jgi:hypothetical protein
MSQLDNAAGGIGDNRVVVTTAGTRVPLASSSTPARSVSITALEGNTGKVVVGGATVVAALATRRGTPLAAGDTVTLDINDLSKVNVDAMVNGEGVSYSYLTV